MDRNRLDRAKAVKRLYENELDKIDSKKPLKRRQAEAASKLDKLLGDVWREDAKGPDGIIIIEEHIRKAPKVPAPETKQVPDHYVDNIKQALATEEGVGVGLPLVEQTDDGEYSEDKPDNCLATKLKKIKAILSDV